LKSAAISGATNDSTQRLMKTFKVAVIGYGWASGAHIEAINATTRAEVTAVYSSRPLDPAELGRRHGRPVSCHDDLDALLGRDDIDVVSICSYPNQHAAHVTAAVRAGKHFILEKPISLTLEDARAVARAVAASRVRGCVCHEGRFAGQFLATRHLLDQGYLGRIHYAELDYYHGIGPWYGQFRWNTRKDAGGSSLLSAGCHSVSSLLLCMGNEVESVQAWTTRSAAADFAPYEYPTTSVSLIRFSGGRLGKVTSAIDCVQPYYRHVHLVGSEGSLLDNRFYSRRFPGLDGKRWTELATTLVDSGDVRHHPYGVQFESFFNALARGEDMPLTSFADALVTHRVVLAADLSAELGRPVALDEVVV